MSDPKKPADDEPKPLTAPPAENKIAPADMTYPTPELDPATGAPLDTRFQSDNSQEAAASKPSPKSAEATPVAEAKARPEADADDEEDDKASKGKEKPRGRR